MMNMNFVMLTLTDVITAAKMGSLGWKPRYSSNEAVRQAIKDVLITENQVGLPGS